MSLIVNATDKNFNKLMKGFSSDVVVLVDFWAEWCAPCKMMNPILEELASEFEGKLFVVKVDVDKNQNLAKEFEIRSIPTMKVFVNGEIVKGFEGASPKRVLLNELMEFLDA